MGRYGLIEDEAHLRLIELAGARGVKTAELAASLIDPEGTGSEGTGFGDIGSEALQRGDGPGGKEEN